MTVYLDRRRTLGDRAAAPIAMRMIGEIDLGPIARARPELVDNGQVPVAGMRLSPDGTHVAILLPSRELDGRSEEHTSELQSLMRISYAVFCLKKKKKTLTFKVTNYIINSKHKSALQI